MLFMNALVFSHMGFLLHIPLLPSISPGDFMSLTVFIVYIYLLICFMLSLRSVDCCEVLSHYLTAVSIVTPVSVVLMVFTTCSIYTFGLQVFIIWSWLAINFQTINTLNFDASRFFAVTYPITDQTCPQEFTPVESSPCRGGSSLTHVRHSFAESSSGGSTSTLVEDSSCRNSFASCEIGSDNVSVDRVNSDAHECLLFHEHRPRDGLLVRFMVLALKTLNQCVVYYALECYPYLFTFVTTIVLVYKRDNTFQIFVELEDFILKIISKHLCTAIGVYIMSRVFKWFNPKKISHRFLAWFTINFTFWNWIKFFISKDEGEPFFVPHSKVHACEITEKDYQERKKKRLIQDSKFKPKPFGLVQSTNVEMERLSRVRDKTLKIVNDNVFAEDEYKRMSLNKLLRNLKFEDVPKLFGSFAHYNPSSFESTKDRDEYLEIKRQFEHLNAMVDVEVENKWYTAGGHNAKFVVVKRPRWTQEEGVPLLRDWLFMLYNKVNSLYSARVILTEVVGFSYAGDEQLYMKDFSESMFVSKQVKKGKSTVEVPPNADLQGGCTLVDSFQDLPHKWYLTPKKIKSIINGMLSGIADCDKQSIHRDIIANFKFRMKVWKQHTVPIMDSRYTWFVPFILPHFWHIRFNNLKACWDELLSCIISLRERVIAYVYRYLDISLLSKQQRKLMCKARSDMFAEVMRTPDVQAMFLAGMPKEQITQIVYNQTLVKFNEKSLDVTDLHSRKNAIKKSREVSISKSRDYKNMSCVYDDDESVVIRHTQDIPVSRKTSRIVKYEKDDDGFVKKVTTFVTHSKPEVVINAYQPNYFYIFFYMLILVMPIYISAFALYRVCRWFVEHGWRVVYARSRAMLALNYNLFWTRVNEYWSGLSISRTIAYYAHVDWLREIRNLAPQTKLYLVEFKSIVHIINCYFMKDFEGATSHCSYLLCTRPDNVLSYIATAQLAYMSYSHKDKFEPHSFTAEDVSKFIGSIFASYNVAGLDIRDVDYANKQFTYINNVKKATSDNTSSIISILRVLSKTLFSYDPLDPEFQDYVAKILAIIYDVKEFNLNSSEICKSKPMMYKVLSVHDLAHELHVMPIFGNLPGFLSRAFVSSFTDLKRHARSCTANLKGARRRITPVSVLLTGPPGVGKSPLVHFARSLLCMWDGIEESPEMTYVYNPDSEYWEGYAQQKFVSVDDLFAKAGSANRVTEAANIIHMVNSAPYSLNMAFGDKGSNFFDSEYVFFSTNLGKTYKNTQFDVGLTDSNALKKRFHLVLSRQAKSEDLVENNKYLVEKFDLDPTIVDTEVSAVMAVRLMHRIRMANIEADRQYDYDHDRLRQIVFEDAVLRDMDFDSDDDAERKEDFEPHNKPGELPQVSGDAITHISRLVGIGVCEWSSSQHFKYYVALFFLLVACVTCKIVYECMFYVEPHSVHRKFLQSNTKRVARQAIDRVVERQGFSAHSNVENWHEHLVNTASRSVIFVLAEGYVDGEYYKESATAFHIRDGCCLTCAHFYRRFLSSDNAFHEVQLTVIIGGMPYTFDIPTKQTFVKNEDLVMFQLPTNVPRPKALYKYLIDEENYEPIQSMTDMNTISINEGAWTANIRSAHFHSEGDYLSYSKHNMTFLMERVISYWGSSSPGESGAPVFIRNQTGKNVLIGMHLGIRNHGRGTTCIALCISKQVVDSLLEPFADFSTHSSTFPHTILHEVPQSHAHNLPTRSKIKRSYVHGWYGPPEYIPAKLRPFEYDGVTIDPVRVALSKLQQFHYDCEPIPNDVQDYLMCMYPRSSGQVVTFEVALNGDSIKGYPSINASTSRGYPYSLEYVGTKGKAPFVTLDKDHYVYQSDFLKSIERMDADLRGDGDIDVFWADILKDETRPIDKVYSGKTRLISSTPLHFLMLIRRYFLEFIYMLQSTPSTKPVAVGIDPHSYDWTKLYLRLNSKKGSVIAGDYSCYDGKVPVAVGLEFLKFVNWWYNDGEINAKVRTKLMGHIFNSKHICGVFVYMISGGNPSGNAITTPYNSVCNIIMMYTVLCHDLNMRSDQFEMTVYGDDNIVTTEREGLRCSDLAPHIRRRFGMEYTHFSKKESDVMDNLSTIRFLGRAFVKESSLYRAPLDMRVVIESTYWTRGDEKLPEVFISTVTNFYIEMSHFGRDVYYRVTNEFLDVIKECSCIASSVKDYIVDMRKPYPYYWSGMYDKDKRITFFTPYSKQLVASKPLLLNKTKSTRSEDSKLFVVSSPETNVKETRNVEFTERAANDAPTTEKVELGKFQDVAPVSTGIINGDMVQSIQDTCNMETFDMDGSLDREFPAPVVTWATTNGESTVLQTLGLPDFLFGQTYIADKLANFRFFKSAVRISYRIVSNKFLYGSLLAVYVPYPYNITGTNLSDLTAYPHVILSASSGDTVVFDIPFVWNQRALDMLNILPEGAMGNVYLVVLNPLVDISGTSTNSNVFVTVRFVDAQAFYPHDQVALSGFVMHSKVVKGKEGRMKSKMNSTSSLYETSETISSFIKTASTVSSYVSEAIEVMRPITMLGLSKPRTVAATQVNKINPFSDINTGKGIDLSMTLGFDPENQISTVPNVAGISVDEMDFRQLCGTPVLSNIITFSPGGTPIVVAFPDFIPFRRFGTYGDFTDWIASNFVYVSGSRKVKIYIRASQFHSARFVFYLADSETRGWQNCYHRIIDVQGDTEVEFTLPYSSSQIATKSVVSDPDRFVLYAYPLSWSQPDLAVTAPIYMNVYTSASDDIEFRLLQDVMFQTNSCPRNDFSKSFPPFHDSITSYGTTGLICGEKYTSVREVIHKYSAVCDVMTYTGGIVAVYNGTGNIAKNVYNGVEMLGLVYCFHRGGRRFKFIPQDPSGTNVFIVSADDALIGTQQLFVKGVAISCSVNPVVEIDVPYNSRKLFEFNNVVSGGYLYGGTKTNNFYQLDAASDDFSFHFICPPPPPLSTNTNGGFSAPNSNMGFGGLGLFFST
jgi:hypothetical protein